MTDQWECADCGRDDFTSLRAAMLCPCDRYDINGYEIPQAGSEWLP